MKQFHPIQNLSYPLLPELLVHLMEAAREVLPGDAATVQLDPLGGGDQVWWGIQPGAVAVPPQNGLAHGTGAALKMKKDGE